MSVRVYYLKDCTEKYREESRPNLSKVMVKPGNIPVNSVIRSSSELYSRWPPRGNTQHLGRREEIPMGNLTGPSMRGSHIIDVRMHRAAL